MLTLAKVDASETHAVLESEKFCRITCTVYVSDGFGGTIGVTGTAGNIFTDCETAGEKACAEAYRNALAILSDAI